MCLGFRHVRLDLHTTIAAVATPSNKAKKRQQKESVIRRCTETNISSAGLMNVKPMNNLFRRCIVL